MATRRNAKKLYFPDGALLNAMEVAVVESERRKTEIMKEPYTVYLVETRPIDSSFSGETGSALWRRYSEFELLRNYLMTVYPFIVMPPLPEKRKLQLATDKFDPEFIERRRQGLECFLLRLASHPTISQDKMFVGFLNQEMNWKEAVVATGFQSKLNVARWKLISATTSVKKPDQRFEDVRSYCESLSANINALIKLQQRMTERQLIVAQNHGGYGKLLSEWSGIENEMADGLQMGGHHIDRYNQQTTSILEEEGTVYLDQLKEYLFFTESLRAIVKKQQQKQCELEKAEDALSAKVAQRDEVLRQIQAETGENPPPSPPGFSLKGISNILFGAETVEAKQEKANELSKQVEEAEEAVRERQAEVNLFVDRALKDYDRFKKQKVRDLTEVMQNYIKMQIKFCKTGLQSWKSAKECFANI
ncbi:sorting nexin-4-like isoform X2 [Rhopilema esculentum]|uniref:sorting nexin-4-like isoform X2 n=1 Tax=Rhopilema esculentum TaxID=499914 RepID=UPI0031DB7CC5